MEESLVHFSNPRYQTKLINTDVPKKFVNVTCISLAAVTSALFVSLNKINGRYAANVNIIQESCAIAKMTAQCALYMVP